MVLVFDVWSDLAMFRKPYTTTSQISFPVPPPTAIAGLISAITGVDHGAARNSASDAAFWNSMHGSKIAIGLQTRVEYYSTTINLLMFKTSNGNLGEHIQSKHQMLKAPRYRIYFHGGSLYPELKKRLEKGEFVFTPNLGVAYALADIGFVGEFPLIDITEEETWVDTIVPLYHGVQIDVIKSRGLHRETLPFQMNDKRELTKTITVIYPEIERGSFSALVNTRRIWLKHHGEISVSQVGEERVSWFGKW